MKNKIKTYVILIVWVLLMILGANGESIFNLFEKDTNTNYQVARDYTMKTNSYDVNVIVNDDNSYVVNEKIVVDFGMNYKHGIYRYFPQKGQIVDYDKKGKMIKVPYYSSIGNIHIYGQDFDVNSSNGNKLFKIGSDKKTVTGINTYDIEYTFTPITDKGYDKIYFNFYGTGWQNDIPAGSKISMTFPKKINLNDLKIYYGLYGETKDGKEILDLSLNGNTVVGILKTPLMAGNALTAYMPVEKGFFAKQHMFSDTYEPIIVFFGAALLIVILLFALFGRDKKIIRSIQFAPPKGLDSAAVGYIIDGTASSEDVVSLLLYWANKGYIKIRNEKDLVLIKTKDLPNDVNSYEKKFFNKLFSDNKSAIGSEVKISSLKYKLDSTIASVKKELESKYNNIYTKKSKFSRVLSLILIAAASAGYLFTIGTVTDTIVLYIVLVVAYFIGLIVFISFINNWYSSSKRQRCVLGAIGGILIVVPLICLTSYSLYCSKNLITVNTIKFTIAFAIMLIVSGILITFMKKRTDEYVEIMGYLVGLREFIETAELDRMQVIAKDSPQLFYHILPYAYVFGISDILLEKMKDLTLESAQWLEGDRTGKNSYTWTDYYIMHSLMRTGMRTATTTISTPKPQQVSGSGKGGRFGGSFGSGGGFSGGGFGGGGGGSW